MGVGSDPTGHCPQDPSPGSLTFAHGEGRSPGTGGGGFAGCSGGGRRAGERTEGANAAVVTSTLLLRRVPSGTQPTQLRRGRRRGREAGRWRWAYKGTAPASAGFFPLKGAGRALASNCRRGTV